MTRLNGGIPLFDPDKKAAALGTLRLQVSASIVGQLLPTYLAMHRARALLAAGQPTDSLESVAFDTAPAIDGATSISIAAADALLSKLGIGE